MDGHSFSTTSLTGLAPGGRLFNAEQAEVLRSRLLGCLAREPGAFLTMPKKALAAMAPLPPDLKVAWFGALRGRNLAQGCEVGFVVGRNLPPVRAVEELAAAFAVALGQPFTPLPLPADPHDHCYPRRVEVLRTADGQGHGITLEFHPDLLGQAILRQLQDAETTQAVDRVRAMFAPKRIIVMGTSIPDVTFARIERWADFHKGSSRVARALATRVLLLSESLEADVRPDIWSNRKAAHRDEEFQELKAALETDLCLGHPVYRDSSYRMSQANAAAVVASFRLPPTKGRGGA